MQSDEQPIEKRFGEAVLEGRQVLGISQKTLASRLSERGLLIDASAISRIEKGVRAIRLSEAALIAATLGFTLSDVEQALDPVDHLQTRREAIDHALTSAYQSLMNAADEVALLAWLTERHPEVLRSLGKEGESSTPTNGVEFIAWLERKWRANLLIGALGTRLPSVELRDAVRSLFGYIASVAVDDAVGDLDGE